jgi:hypothetical protein
MALPYRYIPAGPTEIPKLAPAESPMAGAVDPPYSFTSKQVFMFDEIPFLQLTRLLDQLSDFATFSNELFASNSYSYRFSKRYSRFE